MLEREMQELLWRHPEKFLHEPLKQFAWETSSDVGRADLVFEDQFGRLLIIEVKRGKLPREAIGQLLDYFGMMKHRHANKSVEMMVVAWTIPPERRISCESLDILCRDISEKTRDIATEVGYVFSSEGSQSEGASVVPTGRIEQKPTNGPRWSFNKAGESAADEKEFLARCDEKGREFFSSLFNLQKSVASHTKITWKHESGFSLQFYFHQVGFAPLVWGYPARNRDGRHISQRLVFPFDRSLKVGVTEEFVNEFGSHLLDLVPVSGGEKQLNVSIAALNADQSKKVLEAIQRFADKAAAK